MTEQHQNENPAFAGVSAPLGEVRRDILRVGDELEKRVHGRAGGLVNDLLSGLEGHTCRIAFIGQVKAGKSSLINALIQKPDFLPTDVNPSTAVVTKLVLGSRSQAADTALFHFFTEEEWENLVSPEPSQDRRSQVFSLPGSRKKLTELQQRAETRLGKDFKKLIGKHHLFSAVTPELLQTYVSANDGGGAKQNTYSDLTRMAEIFLDSGQQSYPSVLIDTPGVNDLFFVRDEITLANLADADVYILVLTAQQPLSRADISLLRLLRGLQKNKIVAVINRVDTLAKPAEEIDDLEVYVRQTLNRECPHATIPVVSASANWGTMALGVAANPGKYPVTESFIRYAETLGFTKHIQASQLKNRSHFGPEDREMLAACSGIPRIIRVIGNLAANAISEGQLLPCASTMAAIAHNAATSSRYGLQTLAPDGPLIGGAGIAKAPAAYKQLQSLVEAIDKQLNGSLEEIHSVIANETQALERYMYRSIGHLSEAQSKAYFNGGAANAVRTFSQEALTFRSELADGFAKHYTDILKLLSSQHRQAESGLRNTIKAMLPALDNVMQFGMAAEKAGSSSVISLGKATALETPEFWEWFASDGAAKGQDYLKRLIDSEFVLIVREIMETCRADLKLFASDGIRRLRLLALGAVIPLAEQLEMSVRVHQLLAEHSLSPEARTKAANEFRERAQQVIGGYESLLAELNTLKKRCFLVPSL
jgi:signal recognition particle receptor subunit beta